MAIKRAAYDAVCSSFNSSCTKSLQTQHQIKMLVVTIIPITTKVTKTVNKVTKSYQSYQNGQTNSTQLSGHSMATQLAIEWPIDLLIIFDPSSVALRRGRGSLRHSSIVR